ncbi:MAG: Citrate transporter, partial [Clostridia bacterium]|nr:Citrate transporter [Clostridia bacterium]
MKKIIIYLKKEPVFVLSFILAIISCFLTPPSLKYISYIDFKVIFGLLCLMIIISGFSKNRLFNVLSNIFLSRCKNSRTSYIAIMGITFFTSMFITNDVALITFVPFAILILNKTDNIKNAVFFITMQTVSANIGSSLMPTGNPQNLFLYYKYNYNFYDFINVILPVVICGGIIIASGFLFIKKDLFVLKLEEEKIKKPLHVLIYIIFFILTLLGIFNFIPFYIPFILLLITVILIDRSILKEVDYILLATFVCFFIFIGNISSIEA